MLDHLLVPLPPPRPPQPLPSLCAVSVADVSTLRLHMYDPQLAESVQAALLASPMRLQPRLADGGGSTVLVSVPPPSEEARQRVLKLVREAGEAARASGRRVRQEGLDAAKAAAKAGLPKDEAKRLEAKLQTIADAFAKAVAGAVAAKEKEGG